MNPNPARLVVVCAALAVAAAGGALAQEAPWRVLTLHGPDAMLPASVAVEQAMRSEIQARAPREVLFYSESVDLVRFPLADLEGDLVALLQKKYRSRPVDVLVAYGTVAMSFGQRHRSEVWPGVPLVFVTAGDRGLVDERPAATTGIPVDFDVAGTLRLAQRLQPNARRLVVVAGVSEFDGYVADAVIEALKRLPKKLEVRFLGDSAYPEILAELRKVPADSIVLYGSLMRDGGGRTHLPSDLVAPISEASAAPVYGFFETYLGQGIVGGSIDSLAGQGRAAGRLALRVLQGENADSIPIAPAPSLATRVDYRQLQRWRLREERLPEGVIVERRPPALWQSHRRLIVGVITLLAMLVAVVFAQLLNRAERRRSIQELSAQLRFERLVTEISATLIDVDSEKVNGAVERALSKVREAMGLDRCALFVCLPGEAEARSTHEAHGPDAARRGSAILAANVPNVFERLCEGETVTVDEEGTAPDAADRPPKSTLLVPVTVSDRRVQGIAFQATPGGTGWPPGLVPRLRLVGEILVSAVTGKRAEDALRQSEERYREVLDSQTDLICRYLPDTTLTYVNEPYCLYFGRTREELIGRKFLELIPEEARETARRHVESLLESPRVEPDEHEVLRADGSIGWHQWVDHAIRGRDGRIIEFQAIGRDITDRKRADEADRRIAQAGRLALLGELTASIAHEVNQPLGAILSNADALEILLESGQAQPEQIRSILSDIRREDLRASEVIRHVRSLVRRRAMEMRPLDINQVVEEALLLADAECRRRMVALRTELAPGLPAVVGDRISLQQLLLNLIVNGMDAMGDVSAGERRLVLRTGRAADSRVEVAVVDAGHGIPDDVFPRLFESFVTTREHGMGLGLSISRSIVEAHGGKIRAENNPGGGATVLFALPVGEASGAAPEPRPS
ncbi:MAG TPA: ATP-binding protein [Thermoanaerobaculia bacterium]